MAFVIVNISRIKDIRLGKFEEEYVGVSDDRVKKIWHFKTARPTF